MPQSCHRCIALAAIFGLALAAFTPHGGVAAAQTVGAGRAAELTRQLVDVAGSASPSVTASDAARRDTLRNTLTEVTAPASGDTALSSVANAGEGNAALGNADAALPKITVDPIHSNSPAPSPGTATSAGSSAPQEAQPAPASNDKEPIFNSPETEKSAQGGKEVKKASGDKKLGAETPLPEPPPPRPAPPPLTNDANTSLAAHIRALIRGTAEGTDPLSKSGVTTGGQGEAKSAVSETPKTAAPPVAAPAPAAPPAPLVPPTTSPAPVPAPPSPAAIPANTAAAPKKYTGDPLTQIVNIDFREMELTNVVALLAQKADINVIAGTDLRGTVTANLRNVTLRQAMETALRMNNLGMLEEEGIYRIVPYEEAVAANTTRTMIKLETAKGEDVQNLIKELTTTWPDRANISVSVNKGPNVLVLSAPKARTDELTALIKQLDVSKPVLPTVTEAIALNYAEPDDIVKSLQKTLTPTIGQITGDIRSRHVIVTDMPIVVEQVKGLIETLDKPVKQVMVETMVVDVTLNDDADTGIKWLAKAVKRQNARSAALGTTGPKVGTLQSLDLSTDMETLSSAAGLLNFGLLTKNINWSGLIESEVRNQNGRLLSNPVVMTVENKEAAISISQEIPYTDLSQTSNGGSQTSTRFKDVGTIFTLTPQVTNDDHIICKVSGKESFANGDFKGVPIEDKRQIDSTMRMSTGQTIFIGGLRKASGTSSTRKMPILGDIPVVNLLFRTNTQTQKLQDLLVFITCNVIKDDVPLTDRQKKIIEDIEPGQSTDALGESIKDFMHPHYNDSLHYKFRRGE